MNVLTIYYIAFRFQTAERHSLQASSNTSLNTAGKIDSLKDELEDASQKVEQCRVRKF